MVRRVIPMTHRAGIQPLVFFILGFPWEDPASIDETLALMKEISPYVDFHPAIASVLVPFPATELYDRYKDQFGFDGWWLSEDRAYDAPRAESHPYYQRVIYRLGAVLDADFFHYPPEVKEKIHEVVRFMHVSNLRNRSVLAQKGILFGLDLSRRLHAVAPRLERVLFNSLEEAKLLLKKVRRPAAARRD
jgi:radical SAM superfamily enzyme YgiQ (UPF0313 family)